MKKYLYGTTALAAAGLIAGPALAATPLHMELGGYFQQMFGYANPDKASNGSTTTTKGMSFKNAEVYFKMRGELDNGLKVGGRLELEGDNGGDQIDQAYLILAGGFGELRLGSINSGRYSYGWNTDSPQVGTPINSGWVSTFVPALNNSGFRFRSVGLSTVIDASNDEEKITYFTPRVNGFQFTASWTPEGHKVTSNSVGQGGASFNFTGPADRNLFYTNGLDFGVSYSAEYNGVGIEAQAGIATADAPNVVDKGTTRASFDDKYLAYNGGVSFSYQGLSAAGSFAVVDQPLAFNCALGGGGLASSGACTASNEGQSYSFGVGYNTGPWGVSVAYFDGQEEAIIANPGDEENEFFSVAASYTLGPGLRTAITYLHADLSDDLVTSAGDNTGDAVIWGVFASF